MLRKCNSCGIIATSLEEIKKLKFIPSAGSKYGYRNQCYLCTPTDNSSQKMRDWKTKHQVWKRYQCTPEEYKERMTTSDYCAICGKNEETSKDKLCYDHDHKTMEFRGVLCRACNRSLGQLGDDLESIMKVVKYLDKQ